MVKHKFQPKWFAWQPKLCDMLTISLLTRVLNVGKIGLKLTKLSEVASFRNIFSKTAILPDFTLTHLWMSETTADTWTVTFDYSFVIKKNWVLLFLHGIKWWNLSIQILVTWQVAIFFDVYGSHNYSLFFIIMWEQGFCFFLNIFL